MKSNLGSDNLGYRSVRECLGTSYDVSGQWLMMTMMTMMTMACVIVSNPPFPAPPLSSFRIIVCSNRTADDVPGKIILDADTLAEQQKGLEKIAQQLRRERLDKEAEDAITFGFCPRAELWNGRCVRPTKMTEMYSQSFWSHIHARRTYGTCSLKPAQEYTRGELTCHDRVPFF